MGLSFTPPSEPAHEDTNNLLETEVNMEMDSLKRHKADGPNGFSPYFVKEDGDVLISRLKRTPRVILDEGRNS